MKKDVINTKKNEEDATGEESEKKEQGEGRIAPRRKRERPKEKRTRESMKRDGDLEAREV